MTPSQAPEKNPEKKKEPLRKRLSPRKIALFKRFPNPWWWKPDPKPQQIVEQVTDSDFLKDYPTLKDDFELLENNLMPKYREFDKEALLRQNQFRWDQVMLIFGGIVVTTLGAFQSTSAASHSSYWFGLAEAVAAAVVASIAQFARLSNAQQGYFSNRLKAELLRSEYFFFLRHIGAYEDPLHREQRLRQRVFEITRPSSDGQPSPFRNGTTAATNQPAVSDADDWEKQFRQFYQQYRYSDQVDFYRGRTKEYRTAQTQATILTTVLMLLATLVSLFGSANLGNIPEIWAVLAVFFPALATGVSAYDSLIAFERVAKLYGDATEALERVEVYDSPEVNPNTSLQQFVDQVEYIFTTEQGQWGQLASQIKVATAQGTASQSTDGGS